MSSAPNQFPRSSKRTASSHQAETQTNSAPDSSSPAETMTDPTSNSTLATPPTRMPSPDDAVPNQDAPEATGSDLTSDDAVAQATQPQLSQDQPTPTEAIAATDSPTEANVTQTASSRHQPIPPASEPMQYRAIGLVRGKYGPSEEQFTRGSILTDDGVVIDAVLLGRVMSLVKKHINLEESHLWVVYPRTREKDLELHMQIVGVWEPEKLNRPAIDDADDVGDVDADDADTDVDDFDEEADLTEDQADQDEDAEDTENFEDSEDLANISDEVGSPITEATTAAGDASATVATSEVALSSPDELDDRYFSVRGEVVYQSEEEQRLLVKIRRSPKQGSSQAKAFKIALKGALAGKAIGYFWDIHVQRENNDLVITEANQIGMVPPQKRRDGGADGPRRGGRPGGPPRRGGPGGQSGPPRKRWQNRDSGQGAQGGRPIRSERPAPPPSAPRQPISKPVKRPKTEE